LSVSSPLRIEVTRADLAESTHYVAACAIDLDGRVLYEAGDIEAPVYLRSAAKPFIAGAIVEAGTAQRFGFAPREVAVIAASHSGEPIHVEAVSSILEKIGLDASALQCGVHWPYDENAADALRREGREPTVLHNNCSGKHAGILALCKLLGADTATYLSATNPAQRYILDFCARVCDDDAATWPIGTDGCGIPVYATSLRHAATSFARLATLRGVRSSDAAALGTVRDAMLAHPLYVAGSGQLDTELILSGDGNLVSKAGAEGIHGVGVVTQGCGYASKVLDGSARARAPSTLAVLRGLGILDEQRLAKLARFARPNVYNRAGRVVGEIRVSPPVAIEETNDIVL
jgi:L-asparaginase II